MNMLARFFGHSVEKIVVLVLAIVAIVALTYFNARFVNAAFDWNLVLVKTIAKAIDPTGKVEVAARLINAERIFLFAEVALVVGVFVHLITLPFRRE